MNSGAFMIGIVKILLRSALTFSVLWALLTAFVHKGLKVDVEESYFIGLMLVILTASLVRIFLITRSLFFLIGIVLGVLLWWLLVILPWVILHKFLDREGE